MDKSKKFVRDKGSMKRFFRLLWKAKLPYVFIIIYFITSMLIVNVGVSLTEYTAEMFAGNVNFTTVILPFLFYMLLSMAIGTVNGIMSGICTALIDRSLRRTTWKKMVNLPMSYYASSQSGEMISRITGDVEAISGVVMGVFLSAITEVYTLAVTLGRIWSYDAALMWTLVATLPLELMIAFILGKLRFGVSDNINAKTAQLTERVREKLSAVQVIKTSCTEEQEFAAGAEYAKQSYRAGILSTWLNLSFVAYAVSGCIHFIITILVGRHFYANGDISLTNWIAFYAFSSNIVNILTAWCGYWTTLKGSQGSVDRVGRLMEQAEEQTDKGTEAGSLSGDIRLEDASFGYQGAAQIFDRISVRIPAGKITAVIGPSGSGKTTLLNLLDRFYPIDSGKIYFGETAVEGCSLDSFRRQITYVTQENIIFSGTLRSNLVLGLENPPADAALLEMCRKTGLMPLIENSPLGLDLEVGENGSRLSGGQRQRIAFAQAFLDSKNYMFLDEATSAMDLRGKSEVWEAIKKEMAGKTVVSVVHDALSLRYADYVVVLRDGKVEAQGELAEVSKTNEFCAKLIGGGSQ